MFGKPVFAVPCRDKGTWQGWDSQVLLSDSSGHGSWLILSVPVSDNGSPPAATGPLSKFFRAAWSSKEKLPESSVPCVCTHIAPLQVCCV